MRNLDWDGVPNLRDLGSLPTRMSGTGLTATGRVARGPRRELFTARSWSAAETWGLRSVVDLRSAEEVGSRGNDPAAAPPAHVAITLAPTEDQSDPEFRAACFPILDSPEYWAHNVRILPGLVRGALEAIADAEPGILVHCSAGRDRTGMITAILLANAGVPPSSIAHDYSESVRAMAGRPAHGGPTHDRQAAWTPDRVEAFLREATPHVRAFVEDPDALMDALAVSEQTRRALRDLLLDVSS